MQDTNTLKGIGPYNLSQKQVFVTLAGILTGLRLIMAAIQEYGRFA